MYSEDLKKLINKARNMCKSWNVISENFGIPISSCRNIVKNFGKVRYPTTANNLKVKGNTKKRLLLGIKSLVKRNTRITSTTLMDTVNVSLSKRTVQRFLSREGYSYLNSKKKIMLTDPQKVSRMEICKKWLIEGASSRKIAFTDETRYNLDGPDNDKSWQHPKYRREKPMRQQGGGSIMIWGMLMPSGQLQCQEVKGNLNAAGYIAILKEVLVPTMESLYDDDWLLQQDNASSHTATKTQQFLESRGIHVLGWPSKSPDLNVIENCWHVLAQNIYMNGAANNLDDLRAKIHAAIAAFNSQKKTGLNIYNSFGARVMKCFESCGNLI